MPALRSNSANRGGIVFKRTAIILSCLLTAAGGFAQQLDPATEWATIASTEYHITSNSVYQRAGGETLKLDAYFPGPRSVVRPTVIYFHGGGLVGGERETAVLNLLPYLARGMDAVNVDYRVASDAVAPAAVEDARCALHWVDENADALGFDRAKIVVAGHSAGGYLALMTGMLTPSDGFDHACMRDDSDWRNGTLRDVKVAAIVNFYGITDFADLLQGPETRNYAVRWFGDLPNRMELARQLSPLSYVRAGLPPIITLAGDKDTVVPYPHAVRLHAALAAHGLSNQLVTIEGGGHGTTSPNPWTREQNLHAQAEVFKFLEQHGILTPRRDENSKPE
jgi:acetyl esterase/lipase